MPDSRKQGRIGVGRPKPLSLPSFCSALPPSPLLYSPPFRSVTASPPTPPQVAVIEGQLRGLDERAMRAPPPCMQVAVIEGQLRGLDERAMRARPGEQRNFGMSHINKRNMEVGPRGGPWGGGGGNLEGHDMTGVRS